MRKTLTVYAIDGDGHKFRVAGYDEPTALKVVQDETIKHICHATTLIAVNDKGEIVATSEEGMK